MIGVEEGGLAGRLMGTLRPEGEEVGRERRVSARAVDDGQRGCTF